MRKDFLAVYVFLALLSGNQVAATPTWLSRWFGKGAEAAGEVGSSSRPALSQDFGEGFASHDQGRHQDYSDSLAPFEHYAPEPFDAGQTINGRARFNNLGTEGFGHLLQQEEEAEWAVVRRTRGWFQKDRTYGQDKKLLKLVETAYKKSVERVMNEPQGSSESQLAANLPRWAKVEQLLAEEGPRSSLLKAQKKLEDDKQRLDSTSKVFQRLAGTPGLPDGLALYLWSVSEKAQARRSYLEELQGRLQDQLASSS